MASNDYVRVILVDILSAFVSRRLLESPNNSGRLDRWAAQLAAAAERDRRAEPPV